MLHISVLWMTSYLHINKVIGNWLLDVFKYVNETRKLQLQICSLTTNAALLIEMPPEALLASHLGAEITKYDTIRYEMLF